MAQTHSLDLESTSSQYASLAANAAFLPAAYTIEAWTKIESSGSLMTIFSKEEVGKGYVFYINSSNLLAITHQGVDTLTSTQTIPTGWVHVAVTWDGTTAKLYINGREDGSSGTFTSVVSTTDTQRIGGRLTTPQDFFDGLIKDVRFFNDVRTQAEIASDAATQTVSNANLIAEWNFNNAATDSSGNGYTLTLNGSPVYSTDIPWEDATQVSGSTYLETSLVAFYELDDTVDAYSTFDLTNNGSATFTTGKIDNAVSLVRASSQSLSNASITQLTGDFGFSAWVNASTIPAASNYHSILARRNADTNGDYHLFLHGDISGKFNYQLRDGGAWKAVASTTIPSSSTWYHVVVTKISGVASMYINGVLESTDSTFPATPSSSTADFYIGAATSPHYWNGLIDEVAVYSRGLHYGDVLDLYNGGSGITFTAPAAAAFIPQMIII